MTEGLIPAFPRGLAVGFAIAAAIGPIGLLCIRRTLQDGPRLGLPTGLGAATADALYAAVAAFGLTAISDVLVTQRRPLGIAGGIGLIGLALHDLRRLGGPARTPVAEPDIDPRVERSRASGPASAYLSTVALTLANPATILSFAAAFVGLGLLGRGGPEAALLVAGVAAGSAAWWCLLVGVVSLFRSQAGPGTIRRIALASSGLIAALGVLAVTWALTGTS